jgi:predicted RND superfamily exporter protein
MVVGIGVDFAIHYLNRFKEEVSRAKDLEDACVQTAHTSGQAITFDVFSNVAGFSVLVVSGFLPIQNFGLLLAFSMFVVGFNTMLMFPAMVAVIKPRYFMPAQSQPQPQPQPALAPVTVNAS